MANVIVIILLVISIGLACVYIHRSRKKGINCIGCPYAASCSGKSDCGENGEDINK